MREINQYWCDLNKRRRTRVKGQSRQQTVAKERQNDNNLNRKQTKKNISVSKREKQFHLLYRRKPIAETSFRRSSSRECYGKCEEAYRKVRIP